MRHTFKTCAAVGSESELVNDRRTEIVKPGYGAELRAYEIVKPRTDGNIAAARTSESNLERSVLGLVVDDVAAINCVFSSNVVIHPGDALVFAIDFNGRGDEIIVRKIGKRDVLAYVVRDDRVYRHLIVEIRIAGHGID